MSRGSSLRVLLVGAGHGHLHVLNRARALRDCGIDLCLISPSTFVYSGLATAVLSRDISPHEGEVDVVALARKTGVRHHPCTVDRVDLDRRQAHLSNGDAIDFDVISFNVGSVVADSMGLLHQPGVWAVKPLGGLLELGRELEAAIAATGRCPTVVIAGGGQSAHEVAAALCGLCERARVASHVTVVGASVGAEWGPRAAVQVLQSTLRARGVAFKFDRVVARAPGACQLSSGETLPCDMLILATGLVASSLVRSLHLPKDEFGRLKVQASLQSMSDQAVFAVGDCSVVDTAPRPCAGVFGVRAAPILVRNLVALAQGERLEPYRPQRRWLSIMDLGNGTGLAVRGRWWWIGPGALRLKRWLDLGFIGRIRM